MGYTVEDMLIVAREKYQMQLIAGNNGWANSISWMLLVEDTNITKSFKGKEMAVTIGLGFGTEEKLLELVRILDENHAAGLIVNIGDYISELPQAVIDYCNEHDLPLMTVPWDIVMSDMIKDLSVRIFLQGQTDEQISTAFIRAIENPKNEDAYRNELLPVFDVDGTFQVFLFGTEDLDSMDSLERRRIGYRLQIYLENISHNAHFFYYNGTFVLIVNAVDESISSDIIEGFLTRVKRRMPDKTVYVGSGNLVTDLSNVYRSYKNAQYALEYAKRERLESYRFDDMGLYRMLYAVPDEDLLYEMGEQTLMPLIEYDNTHRSEMLLTLYNYIKCGGSVQKVSEKMFIHKNTIVYRMNKIKELLGDDLEEEENRIIFYIACLICLGRKK